MSDIAKSALTMGVFDILHTGHETCLAYCQSLSSTVIVGLWPDEMVRRLKGEARPYNSAEQRLANIIKLPGVSKAFISENFPDRESGIRAALVEWQPDYVVVSNDRQFQDGELIGVTEVRIDPTYTRKVQSTTFLLREMRS